MGDEKLPVDIPGIDKDLKQEIEARIAEYEEKYEPLVFKNTDAVVPRVRTVDYLIAAVINAILVIYFVIAILGGG
jgi:hypothetical protein